jgi:hypothetical protein
MCERESEEVSAEYSVTSNEAGDRRPIGALTERPSGYPMKLVTAEQCRALVCKEALDDGFGPHEVTARHTVF